MIQSSASFLGRFLASAGSVFSSLTLEANMKICIVTQYKVHQCILMPNILYFNWRVLLSHIPTRNLAVLIWTKYEGKPDARPTWDNPYTMVCPPYCTLYDYSKHGYDLVFISKQVWPPQVKYGLVSRPMPTFPSWGWGTESWAKTLKQGHHTHGQC